MEAQDYSTYQRKECAVFLRTAEHFGGLSNMAGGYSLLVNRIRILTSEALYQACRFPNLPEVQKLIIGQASPMTAKMKSKPFRKDSRPDWDELRIDIMRWCLRVKLAQHLDKFGELLLSTDDQPIVEESYRDQFWGAKPTNSETLVGTNMLGRLLVEVRERLKNTDKNLLQIVEPPAISQFLLFNKPIGVIEGSKPSAKVFSSVQTHSEQLTIGNAIADLLPVNPSHTTVQHNLASLTNRDGFNIIQHGRYSNDIASDHALLVRRSRHYGSDPQNVWSGEAHRDKGAICSRSL